MPLYEEEDEYDDDGVLPPDIPSEKLSPKIDELADGARKIGLYLMGGGLIEDAEPEEGEEPHHQLVAQFEIGDIAWSDRVQDPEAEATNDQIRKIEKHMVADNLEELRRQYLKDRSEGL